MVIMRFGLAKMLGSMAVLGALVWGLWPQTAWAIECENEMGSCKVELDGDMVTGSCACADCSPSIGWAGGSPGDEPVPEPTEEDCLSALATHCDGEPVTDPPQTCTSEALELCESGLVDFYMACGAPTNREEEICVTVACCEEAEEMGIEELTELWECLSQYEDCEEAETSCAPEGDGTDGAGGGGQGDDDGSGDDGNQDDGLGTGSDEGAEDGSGDSSDDTKGCSCAAGGAQRAPLLLLPLFALARRRRH